MLWTSSQSFAKNARSSLVTTDLASSLNRLRNDPSNSGDANKKTLYYTPWNGRFLMRYKGRVLVFRRQYQAVVRVVPGEEHHEEGEPRVRKAVELPLLPVGLVDCWSDLDGVDGRGW